MEFFEYMTIPQYIIQFARGGITGGVSLKELYILLGVAGGAYLVCLVMGGLGLYVMAERAGVKHSWLGFLPFANTYYAGKVAGETSFFGRTIRRSGLYAMIAEIVYCALEVCALITRILLCNPAYYETTYTGNVQTVALDISRIPVSMQWMVNGSTWFMALALAVNLVMLLFLCIVYTGLFRKYCPGRAFILTVISILLPIRAFVLFAIRNKKPMNFEEYLQSRFEQAMRSAGIDMEDMVPPSNPFSDFSNGTKSDDSSSSPFEEFNDEFYFSPFDSNDSDDSDDQSR